MSMSMSMSMAMRCASVNEAKPHVGWRENMEHSALSAVSGTSSVAH
jgi:hypothetical protein